MDHQLHPTLYDGKDLQLEVNQSDPPDQESRGLLTNLHRRNQTIPRLQWKTRSGMITLTILNLILFSISIVLFGVTWYSHSSTVKNAELRRVSVYSPVYDSIELGLHQIQVNGTFYPPDQPSIARQMPNPEADSVWEDYELVRPVRLTKSQIRQMGKDPLKVSKYEDKHWGFGDDAYVGDLDVFHQLHCLNTLRQYAYAEYYNLTAIDASDGNSVMALHVNHCVDILFQEIQCSGNVGFITSGWVENQRYPQPDMSVFLSFI
ncbi:hypothetical protein F5B22DRAFT_622419 [Xylaria bambusicola]|uniref:uncharacterized protein n=1 Tax=Xylaria bambusicola TaxID=326684 RepID=UPI0020088B71|nr:uncharacterized protein F5B22DRAFT_622419 [Xylaria bambusicola]KAI0506722.1 hypothetical protein F5B22DRAFT_622419 [Xylaria bambusicola]